MIRRAVLVPLILAAVVSVARAEEVTSEGWGGFIAWQEYTEWGMDGGVEEQPAYIFPAEYLDWGTKLLECTNIHLSTQADAVIRISLLKLDWGGQRVPRWPNGPPAMIPVYLHTHLEISADGAWNWQDEVEQVDATFDFDDGQFAYYSVNVNRDEDLEAGWRDVISQAIFDRIISPWDGGPLVIVHQSISPEYLNQFPEPDWMVDTWGDFTASVTISIEPNEPPVAVATADPVEVAPGEPVTFSAAQSTDPNDDPLVYFWEFSDGEIAQGVEVEHSFDEPGQQGAILTVDDGRFASDETFAWVLVKAENEPPVATLSVEPELTLVGLEVTFHTTGTTDPDGDDLLYVLDFGDGTPPTQGVVTSPYADLAVKHSYQAVGEFTARLTVRDPGALEDAAEIAIRVVEIDVLAIDPAGTKKEPEIVYAQIPRQFSARGTWYGDDGIPKTADDMTWDVTALSNWGVDPEGMGTILSGLLTPAMPTGQKATGSVIATYSRKYDELEAVSVVEVWTQRLVRAIWTDPEKESPLKLDATVGKVEDFAGKIQIQQKGEPPQDWDYKKQGPLSYSWWVRKGKPNGPTIYTEEQKLQMVPPSLDFTFNEVGEYWVGFDVVAYAKGKNLAPSPPQVTVFAMEPPLVQLDIDGDTDQTGEVDHSKEEERRENVLPGVIVLPNWDDDDEDEKPDCLVKNAFALGAFPNPEDRAQHFDNIINGEADKNDMTKLCIKTVPDLPENWVVKLQVKHPTRANAIRIFDEQDNCVILPELAVLVDPAFKDKPDPYSEYTIGNIRGDGRYLTYHVEGILPGIPLSVKLIALDENGKEQERGSDSLKVQVAPFILAPNSQAIALGTVPDARKGPPVTTDPKIPGAVPHRDDLANSFEALLGKNYKAGLPFHPFFQDHFQGGYAQAPDKQGKIRTMNLLMRLPAKGGRRFPNREEFIWPTRTVTVDLGKGKLATFPGVLRDGLGVFDIIPFTQEWGRGTRQSYNYGGGIEVTWPLTNHKLGRVMLGRSCPRNSYVRRFFTTQKAQLSILNIDASWTASQHVDVVVSFLKHDKQKKQYHIAIPDTQGALDEIDKFAEGELQEGNDWRLLFVKSEVAHGALTADSTVESGQARYVFTVTPQVHGKLVKYDYIHFYEGPWRHHTFLVTAVRDHDEVSVEPWKYAWGLGKPEVAPKKGDKFSVGREPNAFIWHPQQPPHIGLVTVREWEAARKRADGHSSLLRRLRSLNESIAKKIESFERGLQRDIQPTPSFLRLPVLFWNRGRNTTVNECQAYTPNLVNGVFSPKHENSYLMPEPFVTGSGQGDIFRIRATKVLAGYKSKFVDEFYYLHCGFGEVHCASVCVREPLPDKPWWKQE